MFSQREFQARECVRVINEHRTLGVPTTFEKFKTYTCSYASSGRFAAMCRQMLLYGTDSLDRDPNPLLLKRMIGL